MKTALPSRSIIIKDRLDTIIKEILAIGKDKIAMIILFGSYARGDWVQDEYIESYVTYSYQSDLDIMLVLKKGNYAGYKATALQHKIEKKLESKLSINPMKPLSKACGKFARDDINGLREAIKGKGFIHKFCPSTHKTK